MNNQEALKKIEEINSVIQASNKAIFSGRHMMLYGFIVLVSPIIGTATQWLTFGHDFGEYESIYTSIANTILYWGMAILIGRRIPRSQGSKENPRAAHPLVAKAFSISKPIMFAIAGVICVFSLTGQGAMIYPIILILLGLLFSIYGKFSIPQVSYIAWSYIACGLLHAYLNHFDIPYLSFYFMAYNGLTYIVMGHYLSQGDKVHAQ